MAQYDVRIPGLITKQYRGRSVSDVAKPRIARSQGIGGRLVEAALATAGRDVAWVEADDEGKARALYERLGFVTVWRQHAFVRQP